MASLKLNLLFNVLGRSSQILLALIFTPIFLHLLGKSNYGFVGIYIILSLWFTMLEIGISQAIGRQIATWAADTTQHKLLAQAIRSGETIIVILATIVMVTFIIGNQFIINLLNIDESQALTASYCCYLFGPLLGMRLLTGYYVAIINSFEDQVWLNCINMVIWTLQNVTMAIGIYFIADVVWFFFIQLFWAIILLLVLSKRADIKLNGRVKRTLSRYYHASFKKLGTFAISIFISNTLIMANHSFDKLLLSKTLPLSETGFLAILMLFFNVTPLIIGILHTIFLPRITSIFAARGAAGVKSVIGRATQLYLVLCLAVNIPLAIFSAEILDIMFQNKELTAWGATPLKWYALGLIFLAISMSATTLFVVFGKGKIYTYCNLINVIIIVPVLYLAIQNYGVMGASVAFFALNVLSAIVWPYVTFVLCLPGYYMTWLLRFGLLPIITGIVGYFTLLFTKELLYVEHPFILLLEIVVISGILLLCLALSANGIRHEMFLLARNFFKTT